MGRRNTRWGSNIYEIFAIGEQLRKQMHEQGQVKDRRHHLRKYQQCFTGRDVIDWLLKTRQVQTRDEAVSAMQILKQHGIFHHVTNEHEFKDHSHLYRFSFDDGTYRINPEITSFYWGFDIYRRLKASKGDIMQEFYLKGSLYSDAFFGCDLVDFIVVYEGEETRENVVNKLRDLLQRDIIKHVTDDYHFCDDKVIYEFSLDFEKPTSLQELLDVHQDRRSTDLTDSLKQEARKSQPNNDTSASVGDALKNESPYPDSSNLTSSEVRSSLENNIYRDADKTSKTSQRLEHRSGLDGVITSQELEDLLSQNNSLHLKINRDSCGFGFVIEGSSPCYVRTVDPLGPAAAAGLRAYQFVWTLNGNDVLKMSHREIGMFIAQTSQLSMTVLAYRNNSVRE